MEQNKRISPRFNIQQMVQLGGEEEFFLANGVDLSREGLCCTTKAPLQPLDQVFGMITLSHRDRKQNISFEAYVARIKAHEQGKEIGLSFTHMEPEDAAFLNEYLAVVAAEAGTGA
jgi:hypothetical protein